MKDTKVFVRYVPFHGGHYSHHFKLLDPRQAVQQRALSINDIVLILLIGYVVGQVIDNYLFSYSQYPFLFYENNGKKRTIPEITVSAIVCQTTKRVEEFVRCQHYVNMLDY